MPQSEARRIGLRTHLHDAAVACGRMPAGVCLRADDPAPQGGRCPYDLGYAAVAVVGNDGCTDVGELAKAAQACLP
jgi:hypothetical protein